jgi:hypothetical protein
MSRPISLAGVAMLSLNAHHILPPVFGLKFTASRLSFCTAAIHYGDHRTSRTCFNKSSYSAFFSFRTHDWTVL